MSQNSGRMVRHENERNPYKTLHAREFLMDHKIWQEASPIDMENNKEPQKIPPKGIQKPHSEKRQTHGRFYQELEESPRNLPRLRISFSIAIKLSEHVPESVSWIVISD